MGLLLPSSHGIVYRENPIIAVDFDDTITTDSTWDTIGRELPGALDGLNEMQELGCRIIIWTCRHSDAQDVALSWLKTNGFAPDAINDHVLPMILPGQRHMRKVFANLYLDDRTFPPFPGWPAFIEWFRENWRSNEPDDMG